MSARMPVDVLVLKGEDEVLADHPAVEPTIFTDGSAEIPVEIWAGNTVFVRFMVADLVRLALTADGREEA